MRRALGCAGMLAAAAGAFAIVACSNANVISPDIADKALRAGLADKGIDVASVTCPSNQPARGGTGFTCIVTTKTHDEIPVDVSVLDDSGRVSWELRGVVIHEKLMGEGIAAKTNGAIEIHCPDKVLVVAVGGSFICDAGSGGQANHVSITIVDKAGNETWKLMP